MPAESEFAAEYRKFEQRGTARTPQELAIYLDQGVDNKLYKLVQAISVSPREGPQHFEIFGNLRDHLGVSTDPILPDDPHPHDFVKFRTLIIVNHNELPGYQMPARVRMTEPFFCVRADDQWIKAFGYKPGLGGSNRGDSNEEKVRGGAPVYPEVLKTHGHAMIKQIEFESPYSRNWPPMSSAQFLDQGRLRPESLPQKLKSFAARAWRRPLDSAEATYVEKVIADELVANDSAINALHKAVVTILSDPRFLYLRQSNEYDLVSRLSYFLWNGPPDETSLALAASSDGIPAAALEREVDRLLADQRSKRFIENFVADWIGFTKFDQTAVDPNFYPQFRTHLKDYMKQESIEFFSEILFKDLSCLNFLESDFVMVNAALAEHYAIPGVHTQRFTPVAAKTSRGGGVLAQGSVLLAYSTGQDAHAVNRGVWIRSRLLGDPPSDPPPGVPSLPAPGKPGGPVSIKQRFELHLKAGTTCYDCHRDIDPWGIATEGFDAVGLPRTSIRNAGPVVKKVVIDKQEIDGLLPLKRFLFTHRQKQFAQGFTRHMLSYALGRPLTYRDEQNVLALQTEFEESGYKMRSLIKAIVTSNDFKPGSR